MGLLNQKGTVCAELVREGGGKAAQSLSYSLINQLILGNFKQFVECLEMEGPQV